MRKFVSLFIAIMLLSLTGCAVSEQEEPCLAELDVLTTNDGVEFVRTPDACFENLPDWPYEPHYVDIDGLRQAYVDVGPRNAEETILLLHGQPSWSYLYRKMIPVLADAGHRVIAMDHLGMGRSDKPIDPDYYTYLGHVERLETFIQELGLENITLFAQDWGSLIGLYVVGTNPGWVDRVVIGNGFLPTFEQGTTPSPLPENPQVTRQLFFTNITSIPAQQPEFYDDEGNLINSPTEGDYFGLWIDYSRNDERFVPSQIVEAITYFDLTPEEEAAYDAPFPSRIAMGGPRAFPGLVNQMPGLTQEAWEELGEFEKPFLTIWGGNDPGNLGQPATQQALLDHIPGAEGWNHVRLPKASHFLQDDQGKEIARRVNEFIAQTAEDHETVAANSTDSEIPRVGYEIHQIVSPNEIITWANIDGIAQAEFDAIELPPGWFKNQPREAVMDEGAFARSPNAAADGEFSEQEHFGHVWRHVATITDGNVQLDEEGLLTGAYVTKYHQVTFDAGSTLSVIISPEGSPYVLISRDFGRSTEDPTIPSSWQQVEYTTPDNLVIQLPEKTLVIRTDNEDSYQGPIPQLEALVNHDDVVAYAGQEEACFSELEIMTTTDGVEFVRTPDACFENLPGWPYEPHYVEIDGLRQAYVDVGPHDAEETILLLHGQPSWSYLYRKMIPVLADAGHRVIAMDHLGMGRSDKPIDPDYYTYLGHVDRLETLIQELELEQGNLTLFAQDWGSLIGLYVVGTNPDWFDRVVIGDGFLPVFEEGTTPFSLPENPQVTRQLFFTNITSIPAQQPEFYDDEGNLLNSPTEGDYFGLWIDYSRNDERFVASQIVEAMTYFDLTPEEEAAYDAPFPSRIAMGGPRAFPGLVNELPGVTQVAWEGLVEFEKPFLTIWGGNDPGNLGQPAVQQALIDNIPGTEGWNHVRLPEASHFLQDDQGEEIARRINEFISASPE